MPIDATTESVICLTDAAGLIPRRRGGRQCHVSTLFRWTTRGCKGVRLESIQVGGTRCTSREALSRFFAALTPSNDPGAHTPRARVVRTPRRRRRAVAAAVRALKREGL